ncbi:MAG: hypothetical protein E7491_04450 [Ruminococcaceae bacterium]|nr:hypothetical protein [Oscillospiraceae bacterium]
MIELWNSLSSLQQIFCCFALPATLVLIIQTVLLLMGLGGDGDTDFDGDFDGDDAGFTDAPDISGIRLFTVRGFVSFFTVAGWLGVALPYSGINDVVTVAISIIGGFIALFLTALAFKAMLKLQDSGNIDPANAIGKTASVYIRVPAARSGSGKVMVTVQERLTEFAAVTDGETDLLPQQAVTVTGVLGNDTLIVSDIAE